MSPAAERAGQICHLELESLQHSLDPQIRDLERRIRTNTAQHGAIHSQLYDRPMPASDLRLLAMAAALTILTLLFAPTFLVSAATNVVALTMFSVPVVWAAVLGVALSFTATGAGAVAFAELLKNRFARALTALLVAGMLFWGLFDFNKARGYLPQAYPAREVSEQYVDSAEPLTTSPGAKLESSKSLEQTVNDLLGSFSIKVMLATDLAVGLLFALMVGIWTDEDFRGWRTGHWLGWQIRRGEKKLRRLISVIEVAKRQMLIGIEQGLQFLRRRHQPYLQAIPVVIALLLLTPSARAQSNCKRLEGIVIDISGSVAKKAPGTDLFRSYLLGAKRLLQTVPGETCVWVFAISTESFGSVPTLLRGHTPAARGIFMDQLSNARMQLVSAFESKSGSLSPSASGTDILGALWRVRAAFESAPKGAVKELFIFSDGVQETRDFDMPALLPLGTQRMIEFTKSNGLLVPLENVRVSFFGASTLGLTPGTWNAVRDFWMRYFKEAGAELAAYSSEASPERR